MNWIFGTGPATQRNHPSDEDLILYLEHELSGLARVRVERHLRRCWNCRLRAAEVESGIHSFMADRNRQMAGLEPGESASRERFLLRLAAAERLSLDSRTAPPLFGRGRLLTAVVAVLLVAVIGLRTVESPTAVAMELLRQSQIAEVASTGAIRPAPQDGLRVASRKDGRWRTGFVSARNPAVRAGSSEVVGELQDWLRMAHLDGGIRLSASEFLIWATRAQASMMAESVQHSGERFWRVTATAVLSGDTRATFRLMIRDADKLPIEQEFAFERGGATVVYVLTREPFPLEVAAGSPPHEQRATTGLQIASPIAPAPHEVPPARWELNAVAADVWGVLHRRGMTLEGNFSLQVTSERVLLDGVVETTEEKDVLHRELAGSPLLEVTIRAAREANVAAEPPTPTAVVQIPGVLSGAGASLRLASEEYFAALLTPDRTPEEAFREVNRFGRDALEASHVLRQHAWGLQRLNLQFPAADIEKLPLSQVQLLERIATDHMDGMNQALQMLQEQMAPVLKPGSRTAESFDHYDSLVALPERIDELNRVLFAGLSTQETLQDVLDELSSLLAIGRLHQASRCSPFFDHLQAQARRTPVHQTQPAERMQP